MKIRAKKGKSAPWYSAGLAFECFACGGCCSGPEEGYVWASEQEIANIASFLGISIAEIHRKYIRKEGRRFSLKEDKKTKDCVFLKPRPDGNKSCSVYPVRPTQCRTWPFWPCNLDEPYSWSEAAKRCIGINRGPIHPIKEIEEKRNATS